MYYLKMDMFSLGRRNQAIKETLLQLEDLPNCRPHVIEGLKKELEKNNSCIAIISNMVGEEILKGWREEFKEMLKERKEEKPITD